MAQKANSLFHIKWLCKYHIVFTPKYRRKIIYGQYKESIRDILRQLCAYKGVEILEGHLMPDHVHMILYNMIFFPRDLVEADAAEKVSDVLAAVVLRMAVRREAHEDDGHAGEKAHERSSCLRGFDGVARDARIDVDDGKGHALLDDDGAFDGHAIPPLCVPPILTDASAQYNNKLSGPIKIRLRKERKLRIINTAAEIARATPAAPDVLLTEDLNKFSTYNVYICGRIFNFFVEWSKGTDIQR